MLKLLILLFSGLSGALVVEIDGVFNIYVLAVFIILMLSFYLYKLKLRVLPFLNVFNPKP